jgi:hypothetical protein
MDADAEKDKQTRVVVGAAMAVHNELGRTRVFGVSLPGGLEWEFVEEAIPPYEREHALPIPYRSRPPITTFRVEFLLLW